MRGFRASLVILIAIFPVSGALACRRSPAPAAARAGEDKEKPEVDLKALEAEVTRLKGLAPSASVAMADVGFHFSNLWFAGQKQNWPLAAYYFGEARQHIRWLVRITPNPKGPAGPVDLQGIFDGIDTSVLKDLKDTIDKKDSTRFPAAYRQALEACYSCHKAVGRPYLRPMVPANPPQSIANFDPAATWPK